MHYSQNLLLVILSFVKLADTDLRQRGLKGGSTDESDIDSILQHHHRMQEKLAEEMLAHARALKQNVTDAGRVVRDDIKVLRVLVHVLVL
jgi:SNARE protein 1